MLLLQVNQYDLELGAYNHNQCSASFELVFGCWRFIIWTSNIKKCLQYGMLGTLISKYTSVVDSNDRERIDDSSACDSAKEELHRMLAEDELRGAVLLVFANKHL
eukprot:36748_1